jgi:hypothetical protein
VSLSLEPTRFIDRNIRFTVESRLTPPYLPLLFALIPLAAVATAYVVAP